MIDGQIILAIIFISLLLIFLILKRKNIEIQKIVFPIIFIALYRTKWGIKLMDKISSKYRELVKLFGYFSIGIGFLGMIFISVSVIIVILRLIFAPATASSDFTLVLPFTHIPGIGYLPFSHWLISIFILAVVHEFAHGVVARAHDLKVKSSGFAIMSVILPIIPAAFVEPDEKQMAKKSDVIQYSVLSAGPVSNIVLAFICFLVLTFALNPLVGAITEPSGFSFDVTNETLPAAQAGLTGNEIITMYNGKEITEAQVFLEDVHYCSTPGQNITLGDGNNTYMITMTEHPLNDQKGYVGVSNVKNEVKFTTNKYLAETIIWFKDLFRWLFLLNFFIGLANLLPLGIVDGGRMLNIALHKTMKNKNAAQKIWKWIAILFLLALIFGLLTNYFGNPFSLLVR